MNPSTVRERIKKWPFSEARRIYRRWLLRGSRRWRAEDHSAPRDSAENRLQKDKKASNEERRERQATSSVAARPPSCVSPRDQRGEQEDRYDDAAERVHDFQENRPESRIQPPGVVGDDAERRCQKRQDDADQAKDRVRRREVWTAVDRLVHHDDDQPD